MDLYLLLIEITFIQRLECMDACMSDAMGITVRQLKIYSHKRGKASNLIMKSGMHFLVKQYGGGERNIRYVEW